MTPSGVNATMDGRSTRPSASGITFGTPPSTYATRLLVVPRSMPTMRDMALFTLPQRVTQVVDHGAQIGASGEALLEPLEERLAIAPFVHQPVPVPRAPDDGVGLTGVARFEPGPLLAKPVAGVPVESLRLRFRQRFLDLQHLLEQLARRLGLVGGALADLPPLLQRDQVLHPRERIPQGAVGAVDLRGSGQRFRLPGLLGPVV